MNTQIGIIQRSVQIVFYEENFIIVLFFLQNHPKSTRNGVLAALSDVLFVAPLIETLRMHSSDEGQREANTYMLVGETNWD